MYQKLPRLPPVPGHGRQPDPTLEDGGEGRTQVRALQARSRQQVPEGLQEKQGPPESALQEYTGGVSV